MRYAILLFHIQYSFDFIIIPPLPYDKMKFNELKKSYAHINLTFIDQAIVSGTNFLTGILFARFLGVEAYGKFTLIWMSVLFFMSLHTAMIISPMLSIGPKNEKHHEKDYYNAVLIHLMIWVCISSFLLTFGCYVFNSLYPDENIKPIIFPLVITLITFQLQDFLRRYFFIKNRAKDAIFIDSLSYLGQLIAIVICINFYYLTLEITLYLIAFTSFNAAIWGKFRAKELGFETNCLKDVTKRHFNFNKWLVGTSFLEWASGNLFMVAAGGILGTVAVGAIKAMQNIIGIIHLFFQACDNFLVPIAVTRLSKGGFNSLKKFIFHAFLLGSLPILTLFATFLLFPEKWLFVFYGNEFSDYTYILYLWCIPYLLFFMTYFLGALLKAIEYTKVFFFSALLTASFSVLFSKFIVSKWGINGVMGGTIINNILALSITLAAFFIQSNKQSKI